MCCVNITFIKCLCIKFIKYFCTSFFFLQGMYCPKVTLLSSPQGQKAQKNLEKPCFIIISCTPFYCASWEAVSCIPVIPEDDEFFSELKWDIFASWFYD